MSKLGPVDHLARLALPWRTAADLTECGKPLADLPAERIITVEDLQRRVRDIGKQRTAFTVCMTCTDVIERWRGSDGRDALGEIAREIQAVQWAPRRRPRPDGRDAAAELAAYERRQRMIVEIDAIAAIIDAHRDEFDAYLAGREETVSLDERRRRRAGGRS